jgi:transmembrane sensor
MKHTIPYSLIAKYLAAQCSENEIDELSAWRALSDENERTFTELSSEWELLDKQSLPTSELPDKEFLWKKIQKTIAKPTKRFSLSFVLGVVSTAAAVALILGITVTLMLRTPQNDSSELISSFFAPEGQKSIVFLPDSTQVWLNSGSSLSYSNNFGDKDRTVTLKGEAFFDVTKKQNLRFIVQAGAVNVVVRGTAFNVKTYEADQTISVSLQRGMVDVTDSAKNKSIVVLRPGERVTVNKSNLDSKVEPCDADIDAIWRLEKLKFEGADISEVAVKLARWYGVEIEVRDSNQFQKYWFTVKGESLTEILRSINELHPIKYSITNNKVVIGSK